MQEQRTTRVVEEVQPVTTTVAQADRVVEKTNSSVVAARVVWYIVGFIVVLLALRVVFYLLGANEVGIVGFIYALSSVFVAPFSGIFAAPTYGTHYFDTASLVAMVVYSLIGWGITKLFTLTHRDATV